MPVSCLLPSPAHRLSAGEGASAGQVHHFRLSLSGTDVLCGMYIYSIQTGMDAKDTLERFIQELRRQWPVARGSLCEVAKPCVRAGCAACAQGEKHLSFIFSYRKDGKQRCLYVSRELVAELRRAIDGGQWVESRMSELGAALVLAHRERRQSTAPRPKRRKPKT